MLRRDFVKLLGIAGLYVPVRTYFDFGAIVPVRFYGDVTLIGGAAHGRTFNAFETRICKAFDVPPILVQLDIPITNAFGEIRYVEIAPGIMAEESLTQAQGLALHRRLQSMNVDERRDRLAASDWVTSVSELREPWEPYPRTRRPPLIPRA